MNPLLWQWNYEDIYVKIRFTKHEPLALTMESLLWWFTRHYLCHFMIYTRQNLWHGPGLLVGKFVTYLCELTARERRKEQLWWQRKAKGAAAEYVAAQACNQEAEGQQHLHPERSLWVPLPTNPGWPKDRYTQLKLVQPLYYDRTAIRKPWIQASWWQYSWVLTALTLSWMHDRNKFWAINMEKTSLFGSLYIVYNLQTRPAIYIEHIE